MEPLSVDCLVNLMTVIMSLVEKTGQKVYLDRGWIMNWDQLKAVGIVLEGYPIIRLRF